MDLFTLNYFAGVFFYLFYFSLFVLVDKKKRERRIIQAS